MCVCVCVPFRIFSHLFCFTFPNDWLKTSHASGVYCVIWFDKRSGVKLCTTKLFNPACGLFCIFSFLFCFTFPHDWSGTSHASDYQVFIVLCFNKAPGSNIMYYGLLLPACAPFLIFSHLFCCSFPLHWVETSHESSSICVI